MGDINTPPPVKVTTHDPLCQSDAMTYRSLDVAYFVTQPLH